MPTIVSSSSKKTPEPPKPSILSQYSNIVFPFKNYYGPKTFGSIMNKLSSYKKKGGIDIPLPGSGLPRVIHYCADQSGCAFWRMIWPGDELLAHNKAVVMTLYQMVTYPQFYLGISAVRLQRQCSAPQLEFVKFLRDVSNQLKEKTGKGFRMIWEIDDIMLSDLIPKYNVCGSAFEDPKIEETVREIVHLCDEITVPSKFMASIYKDRLKYDKISVIPNYAPKSWATIGYNRDKLLENYKKHSKKPRVLYAGSGTHFDVANKVDQQDDFSHVVDAIAQDILIHKKYEWVFFGALPLKLKQFMGAGIEFHDWTAITDYSEKLKDLNVNICLAPLANNEFSRSKANIKLTESGSQGIPCIAQNLECYNSDGWKYLFNTSEEMFKIMENVLKSEESYMDASDFSKEYSNKYFISDHLDEYTLVYTTDYGSDERRKNESFLKNNPDQFK